MGDRPKLVEQEAGVGSATAWELEQLLAQPVELRRQEHEATERFDGIVVGRLVGFRDTHEPLVTYAGQPGTAALIARASVDLYPEHIGHEVTLAFERGDPLKPIVSGRIRVPSAWPLAERSPEVSVDADGRRLTLTAHEQLVLRCGAASITLTAAGKVVIQGAYVSSRSSGLLRIIGGSVQIN